MSDEYIDFKKEFEDFKKELKDSKPLFDDDNLNFTDFDDYRMEQDSVELDRESYPNISLEDEKLLLNLIIKKDYSKIKESKRKEEIIKDLNDFIEEFSKTDEFHELMDYYNRK